MSKSGSSYPYYSMEEANFDETGLARRVLEFPDTGSDNWYAASAITLAAAYLKLRAERAWQPIDTCPDDVREALLFWPALKLNDDGYTTDGPFTFSNGSRGLIGRGVREPGFALWEGADFELEANGPAFDDNYAFGNPTHWMPLPAEPPTP